jgi:tetratricopeptide (TPR) repeat protein
MKWKKTRWFLAACLMLLSVKMMTAALMMDGGLATIVPVLVSMACFITSVLLISPETVFTLAEWCSRPFAAILFPSEHFNRPPLSYKLARYYRDAQRWQDAARQYRKIIRYYPKEADAYLELRQVAEKMGDHKMKQKYAALFRKRFKTEVSQAS